MKSKVVKYEEVKEQIIEESRLTFLSNILGAQVDSGLTPGQFVYLCLLYFEDYSLIYKYCETSHQKNKKFPFSKEEIDQLFFDKLITESWSSMYPDDAILTSKGRKLIERLLGVSSNSVTHIKDKLERFGQELVEAYPDQFFGTQGQRFPTKGYSRTALPNGKYVEGQYNLYKLYYDAIEGSEDKHKEVLDKIRWGLNLNGAENRGQRCPEIRTTLMKFVINKCWETIKPSDDGEDLGSPLLKLI